MFGEPPDAESACNARLFIADNYGDNSSTMRCQLAPNHDGPHKEQFERENDDGNNVVVITWTKDERKRCDHGCGQWDHAHQDFVIIAHAIIDGSHGGARTQNGLSSSAKTGPGHYAQNRRHLAARCVPHRLGRVQSRLDQQHGDRRRHPRAGDWRRWDCGRCRFSRRGGQALPMPQTRGRSRVQRLRVLPPGCPAADLRVLRQNALLRGGSPPALCQEAVHVCSLRRKWHRKS